MAGQRPSLSLCLHLSLSRSGIIYFPHGNKKKPQKKGLRHVRSAVHTCNRPFSSIETEAQGFKEAVLPTRYRMLIAARAFEGHSRIRGQLGLTDFLFYMIVCGTLLHDTSKKVKHPIIGVIRCCFLLQGAEMVTVFRACCGIRIGMWNTIGFMRLEYDLKHYVY